MENDDADIIDLKDAIKDLADLVATTARGSLGFSGWYQVVCKCEEIKKSLE